MPSQRVAAAARWSLVALAAAGIAGVYLAGREAAAEPRPFHAVQSFRLGAPPGLANPPLLEFSFEADGVSEVGGATPAAFTLPRSAFTGSVAVRNITAGGGAPLASITFQGTNLTGSFQEGGGGEGGFGGAMRVLGNAFAKYRLLRARGEQVIPLDAVGTSQTLMRVESLTFDLGPTQTFMVPATVTIRGGRWTTGPETVTAMNRAPGGTPFTGTEMATGFDSRTAQGGGTIQLVTPILVYSAITLEQPGVGTLSVTFAPEPAAAMLAVTGLGVLVATGRRSARPR